MLTLTIQPLYERGTEAMGVPPPPDKELEYVLRKIKGIRWSPAARLWYLPLSRENYRLLRTALEGKALLNTAPLRRYLEQRKAVFPATGRLARGSAQLLVAHPLSAANRAAFDRFMSQLQLKAYSPSTIRTYRNEFLPLLRLLGERDVATLGTEEIRRYLLHCIEKQGLKETTLHSRINALKFYFEQVLGRERMFLEVPRPKKPRTLPGIFSQDEVAAILNSVRNKKHKAMLMLAYSAGLRVSEVVSLKTYDINSQGMTILIRQAKGKKDRMVGLSAVLLVMLRDYARDYQPDKRGYLFEGSRPGTPYSSRSLQEVLQAAKRKAGVLKPGSIHSLRHSFATHLIDKGTDVTMIQKLLGHQDIKTTLRYLHTSNKDLLKIISPLDDLRLT